MGVVNTGVFRGRAQETYLSKSVAGSSNVTLTVDEARHKVIKLTGELTGNIEVDFPLTSEDAGEQWWINNATTLSAAETLTITGNGSTGIAITNAKKALVVWNGSDFEQYTTDK